MVVQMISYRLLIKDRTGKRIKKQKMMINNKKKGEQEHLNFNFDVKIGAGFDI
jgi:hypothetical protein